MDHGAASTDHRVRGSRGAGEAFIVAVLLGIVAGSLVAALELNPAFNYHTFLYLSFASGSVGLWALVAVAVARRAPTAAHGFAVTLGFLGGAVGFYFLVRYSNYLATVETFSNSTNELLYSRSALGGQRGWETTKTAVMLVSLAGCVVMAVVSWALVRFRSMAIFWVFAAVPLFMVTFEAMSYFVPMLAYVHIGLVPTLVDVGAMLWVAWTLLAMGRPTIGVGKTPTPQKALS